MGGSRQRSGAGVGAACSEAPATTCLEAATQLADAVSGALPTQGACADASERVIEDLSVVCEGGAVLGLCPVAVRAADRERVQSSVYADVRGLCADVDPSCRASSVCLPVERVACTSGRCALVRRSAR